MITLQIIKSLFSNADISEIREEPLNSDYEGITFQLMDQSFRSRVAKKTPKKRGYFVVFWVKDAQGKNQPYSEVDALDKTIVLVVDEDKRGLFVFPKEILVEKGVLTSRTSPGKMALRVYPSWETDLNPSAMKTQQWQAAYFIDISGKIPNEAVNRLFCKE